MNGKLFCHLLVFTAAIAVWILGCSGKKDPTGGRRYLPLESVSVTGELQDRIALSARRMSGDQPFTMDLIVEDVARRDDYRRRFEEWEGDISGRWLWSMSLISRLTGVPPDKMGDVVNAVLDCANENGTFGVDRESEGWEEWGQQMWGHNRLLLGLTEYCRLTGDENALKAAEKLADYLADSVDRWDSRMIGHKWWNNYTSSIESLTDFYQLVPKKAYLEASRKIAGLLPEFGNYHSHSFLSGLIGQVNLYLLTGEAGHLERVERLYWEELKPAVLPGADIPEWYPVSPRNEGCSVADWIRINLRLWLATGRAVYLEAAESTVLNSLSYCQTPNGFFSHNRLAPWGYPGMAAEVWWCCTQHGAGCLVEWAAAIFAVDDESVRINFQVPSSAVVRLKGAQVELRQQTSYPGAGQTRIELKVDQETEFKLRIRIPSWVDSVGVIVGGIAETGDVQNGYLDLWRSWSGETTIDIEFPVPLRIVRADGRDWGETVEMQIGNIAGSEGEKILSVGSAGMMYGPIWLGTSEALATFERLVVELDASGRPMLEPATEHPSPYAWSVTGFAAEINDLRGGRNRRLELKPLSSWTAEWAFREEMVNFVVDGEKARRRQSTRFIFPLAIVRAD
jgi:hypothetical protein